MRIATWNVNSVNTLTSWYPFADKSLFPDFNSILNSLSADIICMQEIKSTQRNLQQEFHTLKDYHAFYNLHPTEGYAGVGTFVKKDRGPIFCELGFSGLLAQQSDSTSIGGTSELIEEYGGKQELLQLDGEGRCVVISFGQLIIFNCYFPASSENKTRQDFKQKFSEAVRFRVDWLCKKGFKVVVAGDMNATRRAIDRYDLKDDAELVDHPPSVWINQWLDSGNLVDAFRYIYPARRESYTCWNTRENRRPVNQGSRIDYHLISSNLLPFLKDCVILKDVQGSDHCPVLLTLEESISKSSAEENESSLLGSYTNPSKPPLGCTRYWQSFGDKQKRLSFEKRESGSFDANIPSLSQRFGSSVSSKSKSTGKASKKAMPKQGKASKKAMPKQGNLNMFLKANQISQSECLVPRKIKSPSK